MMHTEWTNKIQYLHVLLKSSMREHTFFNVPFLDIFYYYFLFQQFTENKCSVQIVDDWICERHLKTNASIPIFVNDI